MTLESLFKDYGIGLTGGIATGKSTVANAIRKLGYRVYDADALAREAVVPGSPALEEIIAVFGTAVLHADGTLNRKTLGALVFADPEKRTKLEGIIHPRISALLHQKLKHDGLFAQAELWFYEASLIFEAKMEHRFREIWVTWCEAQAQLFRLMERDKISAEYARKIIDNQMPAADKKRMADFVLTTDQSHNEVVAAVQRRIEHLKALLEQAQN